MTTAQDLIAALEQRRLLKRGRPDVPGEMPAGWQHWFDAMPRIDTGAARAQVDAWVQPLAQRLSYAGQGKATRLGLPFFHLQRLGRPFDPRDERILRIGVGALDILLHLLLAGLLLWLMYLRFMELARQGDEPEQVIQVEFIGRGNAATGGGALANTGAQSAPASAAPALRSAPTPEPSPQAAETPAPAEAPQAIEQVATPAPQAIDAAREAPPLERTLPPPAEARQVLQVSEVPQPQPEGFKLPPPRERSVTLPQPQLREVQPRQQVEAVPTLDAQPLRTLQPAQRQAQLRTPELKEQVRDIEVFTPDASMLTREHAAATSRQQAEVRVPQLQGQVRELPLKADAGATPAAQPGSGVAASGKAPTAGSGADKTGATGAGQAQAGAGQGARAAPADGRGVSTAGKGAGPGLKPAPGGWPGAAKSDDWGASRRNVAGTGNGKGRDGDGKSGLFNGDGSARLPDEWSKQDGLDLDRAGTWLKRPGLEYRGTRFDKYWIPQGTLLQEWVRKGVKELSIPIPGTGIRLKCVVSLLQFGGGCMPYDPDVNEQSSTGRAAPDVPFKPELQEDNGSVREPVPVSKPVE